MDSIIKILEDAQFSTIEDLYNRREEIRDKYQEMDFNMQKLYKWYYFYQLCCIEYDFKSAMWDYICEIGGSEPRVSHQYRMFMRKKEKYHLKYLLEEQKKKDLM